jgi:hypothetical protein
MTRSRLATLGLLMLMLALGAWFYFNFESASVRKHVGYQGEARRNSLLAATRLYERMGKQVRTLRRAAALAELPPGGTLILAHYRTGLVPRNLERVMAWVGTGGHLIVAAERHANRDPLLDWLEIERRESTQRALREPVAITLPHVPREMRVVVRNRVNLVERRQRALFRVDDREEAILLHYRHGAGQVSVLASLSFLRNVAIGEHDHAEFAWQLLQFNAASPEIVMAPHIEADSLRAVLIEHAWQALVVAALLLAAWLWRVIPRFGPLVPDPLPVRRRLLDHLRASGLFHWNHGNAARLTGAAREACLQKVGRMHPGLAALPMPQRAVRMAQLARLPEDQVLLALSGQPADPSQFTLLIRTLQAIEAGLTRRGTG